MKEALRHFITKTNMLNFLVSSNNPIYAMLCFHTVVSDIDLERKKHVITDTVVSKALSIRVVILPFSPGQNRNVQYIIQSVY